MGPPPPPTSDKRGTPMTPPEVPHEETKYVPVSSRASPPKSAWADAGGPEDAVAPVSDTSGNFDTFLPEGEETIIAVAPSLLAPSGRSPSLARWHEVILQGGKVPGMGSLIPRSLEMWVSPLMISIGWALIPLDVENISQSGVDISTTTTTTTTTPVSGQRYELFSTRHAVFSFVVAYLALMLVGQAVPMPRATLRALLSVVIALIDFGLMLLLGVIYDPSAPGNWYVVRWGSTAMIIPVLVCVALSAMLFTRVIAPGSRLGSWLSPSIGDPILHDQNDYAESVPESSAADQHTAVVVSEYRRPSWTEVWLLTALALCFVATLAYAVLFKTLYFEVEEDNDRLLLLLSFSFGIPIFIMGNVIVWLGDKLDAYSPDTRMIRPAVQFSAEAFYATYYRFLFISVTSWPVFASFMGASFALQLIQFPMRTTRAAHRVRRRIQQVGRGYRAVRVFLILFGESAEAPIAVHRAEIATHYYLVAMSQRIAMATFAFAVLFLRSTWNAQVFPFNADQLSDERYQQLLDITLAMFLTEWGISALVHILLRFATGTDDPIVVGQGVVSATHTTVCCAMMAAVVSMSVLSSLNSHVFL